MFFRNDNMAKNTTKFTRYSRTKTPLTNAQTSELSDLKMQIKPIEHLSKQEESIAIGKAQAGCREATSILIRSNFWFIVGIARKYVNKGLSLSDLVSLGFEGFIVAIDKFDLTLGRRLKTYATWWVKQHILRQLTDASKTVRIPSYMQDRINKYTRVYALLEEELQRPPYIGELAAQMKLSVKKIKDIQSHIITTVSFESMNANPDYEDDNGYRTIPDPKASDPVSNTRQTEASFELFEAIKQLTPKERVIIKARYGLDDGEKKTLSTVSNLVGLSRERVRQIEKEIKGKLKKILSTNEPIY